MGMKHYFNLNKYWGILLSLTLIVSGLIMNLNSVNAQPSQDLYGLKQTTDAVPDFQTNKETDLSIIAGRVINYIFGFVGIIFLIMILIGGYKWMSSGGNEERVADGKKMIVQGINGMIAIFLAYALTYAVLSGLKAATSSTQQ
ncbi:hypothetical protein C4569_04050 [Candidatus Parcubacteria bacterium]|nr:MAG: hypothetical protein C4569_04050 [Candidatus Parcubacteria bacterium]